jgi:STE24 endopeptidase
MSRCTDFSRGSSGSTVPPSVHLPHLDPSRYFSAAFLRRSDQLLATPLFNMVSRRQEAAADWAALNATHEPATDRALMRRLTTTSLSAPDPPGWAYALYGTHPTAMQRIAMAYAWEERSRQAASSP